MDRKRDEIKPTPSYAQTFPAISSASLRTSFFLYVFAFPSNVSFAPRTSSSPWRDDSHAGDR